MANERLRAVLTRDGWTLTDFAEAVGVDPKTVERWITKERTPHRRIAVTAAKRLGEDPRLPVARSEQAHRDRRELR